MEDRLRASEQDAELISSHLSDKIAKRRRMGSAKEWIVLLLALGLAGAVYVGLYPWVFFMGGNFHPLGYWRGWGRMHSKTAGDYFLYVEISPFVSSTNNIIPHTPVQGKAHLCTPRGERYYLRLSGYMPPHIYLNTVGKPIQLGMSNWRDIMPIGRETHPSFSLWGRWVKGEIIADDRKTLSLAFLPDGSLRPEGPNPSASQQEERQITLHEGTYSEWETACATDRQ